MDISIELVQGFTKAEAFEKLSKFNIIDIPMYNCTKAWEKYGRPAYTSKEFETFCCRQLEAKTKGTKGLGCYIILEPYKGNTRKHSMSCTKLPRHKGKQTYNVMHVIYEVKLKQPIKKNEEPEILSIESPIASYPLLAPAIAAAKQYTIDTQKDCIIQKIKVPEYPNEFYSYFKPSRSARKGTFIAFGINKETHV